MAPLIHDVVDIMQAVLTTIAVMITPLMVAQLITRQLRKMSGDKQFDMDGED